MGGKLQWPKPAQGLINTHGQRATLQRDVLRRKALHGLSDDMLFFVNPDFKLAANGKVSGVITPRRK